MLVLSGLVIVSYLLEALARRIRLPSVLFLIAVGIVLRLVTNYYNIATIDFLRILPGLGTAGLILIVFEGALEINYSKRKNTLIRNAALVALIALVFTSVLTALYFHFHTGQPFHRCLVNAIPFGVISSSIAIPSASVLSKTKREFITYESSFSDILGIVFFNYALVNTALSGWLFVQLGVELISVTVLSLVVCLGLVYMLKTITHHVKFFAILSVVIFVYVLGKAMHLSSLVLVLMFGLILNNLNLIRHPWFVKYFHYEAYEEDFQSLHRLTAEAVFFVKTFFFIAFGFIIDFTVLADPEILISAGVFLAIMYAVRFVALKALHKAVLPELFFAPRGLISILLYLSVPLALAVPIVNIGFLLVVVLVSSAVMALGRFFITHDTIDHDDADV